MTPLILLAVLLGGCGLLLPVDAISRHLAEPGSQRFADLVAGFWIFKALLVAHAFLALVGPRLLSRLGWSSEEKEPQKVFPVAPMSGPEIALLVAILLSALGFRLHDLGDGLWYDEIQTLVDYVRLPLGQLLTTFDSQNQHLLYSFAARLSVLSLGESAAALRLPAVVFGVISLGALFLLASRVTARREAFLATALLAFSYHHVWFSQNARGYTGLMACTVLGTLCFTRLLSGESNRPGRIIVGYGVVMALAIYTHLTAIIIVAGHTATWVFRLYQARRDGRHDRNLLLLPLSALWLAGSISLLLYAPVLPQLVRTMRATSESAVATKWQSPLWLVAEAVHGLQQAVPGGWITVAVGALVSVAGVISYWRRDRAFTMLLTIPPVLTALAIIGLKHNLWPRFFFFAAGFAVLLVIRGVFDLANRVAGAPGERIATAVLVMAVALSGWSMRHAWNPKQDYGGARNFVKARASVGDAIATIDLTDYPYQAYYREPWAAVKSLDGLLELERTHRRVWLLYTFPVRLPAVLPEVWTRIQANYHQDAIFPGTVGGGAVVVMSHGE